MKKLINSLIFMLLSAILYGQAFISSVEELHPSKDCKMELLDGTMIEGAMASAFIANGF